MGATGVIEGFGVLEGADVLEAAERKPLRTGTRANEDAGLRVVGQMDDVGVAAWKTSPITSTTDLLTRKANRVSLRFSWDKVKFLSNLFLSNGTIEMEKKKKDSIRIQYRKRENAREKLKSTGLMTVLKGGHEQALFDIILFLHRG